MRVLAKINKNDPKKKCLLSTFSQHFVDNKFHCFLFSQLFSPFVFVGLSNSSKGKCSSLKTGKCDLTPQKWAWGSSSGNSIRDAFFSLLTANSSWLSNRPPLPACVCSPRAVPRGWVPVAVREGGVHGGSGTAQPFLLPRSSSAAILTCCAGSDLRASYPCYTQ